MSRCTQFHYRDPAISACAGNDFQSSTYPVTRTVPGIFFEVYREFVYLKSWGLLL